MIGVKNKIKVVEKLYSSFCYKRGVFCRGPYFLDDGESIFVIVHNSFVK